MKLTAPFINAINKLRTVGYNVRRVARLLNDPKLSRSYYPEAVRKSKGTIWRENLLWLLRNNEVNQYYYVLGLDRKDADLDAILPYQKFRAIRDRANQKTYTPDYNYICLLRDKFVFGQYLKSLHFPTPQNIALLNKEEVTWLEDMKTEPLASLTTTASRNLRGFCKTLSGMMGEGAFTLRLEGGRIFIKDAEVSLVQLREQLKGQYLLQEQVVQHPQLNLLHAASVNTLRINTFNSNNNITVFSAALRIGTKNRSVDNWASGGVIVGIDLETGRLRKEGFLKPGYGGRVTQHPDTGILFEGFEIPFFQESLAFTQQLHRYFYGLHSVGWDIAITPEGPIFIEGNDDWEGGIPMALEENFKERFLKMYRGKSEHASLRPFNVNAKNVDGN